MSNLREWLKAQTGHPSPAYVEHCWDTLVEKARKCPGRPVTHRFGLRQSMSVVVPPPRPPTKP